VFSQVKSHPEESSARLKIIQLESSSVRLKVIK